MCICLTTSSNCMGSLNTQYPLSLSLPPSLSPSLLLQTSVSIGTVLVSMCYNTDSKKLSIILLRAKDLNKELCKETGTLYILNYTQ